MSDSDEEFILEEDDLEEGEITDDSETDTEVNTTDMTIKPKKLPKRYNLHDRKASNEKHKKVCKHAHHLNHKIKDKNKSVLSSIEHKKHKSSCHYQRQKSSKNKVSKRHSISPSYTNSLNNQNSSFKSAFRNFTSPPRPVLQNPIPNNNHNTSDDPDFTELLSAYKICRKELVQKRKLSDTDYREQYPVSKKSTPKSSLKSHKKQPPSEKKKSPTKIDVKIETIDIANEAEQPLVENTPKAVKVEDLPETKTSPIEEITFEEESEEDEDEEELRRIALATCLRAKQKTSETSNSSAANSPTPSLSNPSPVTVIVNGDNHDVVDMDLDDEDFVEDVHNNLFVIDNQPVVPTEFNQYMFYGNYMNNNFPIQNYLPQEQGPDSREEVNDLVEEAILRAEVLTSMNKKPLDLPSPVIDNFPELENMSASPSSRDQFCKSPLYNSEENVKQIEVVKLTNSKFQNSKALINKPRNINATQNRLIITLNNDSSSEESDAEDTNKIGGETAVASIDALISSARQKSNKTNGENLNHVSCLSKAQQEEYKKLRNILAEKEPMTSIQQVVKEKIAAEQQHLNFLANKINLAKKKLDKEVGTLRNNETEVLNKKKVYISSKLKFQLLQEQLHAAKLAKTTNLKSWKVHEAKLVNAKSAVSKQKALIEMLETELNNRRLQFEQNSSSPLIL